MYRFLLPLILLASFSYNDATLLDKTREFLLKAKIQTIMDEEPLETVVIGSLHSEKVAILRKPTLYQVLKSSHDQAVYFYRQGYSSEALIINVFPLVDPKNQVEFLKKEIRNSMDVTSTIPPEISVSPDETYVYSTPAIFRYNLEFLHSSLILDSGDYAIQIISLRYRECTPEYLLKKLHQIVEIR